jgi:hypothetical protein
VEIGRYPSGFRRLVENSKLRFNLSSVHQGGRTLNFE